MLARHYRFRTRCDLRIGAQLKLNPALDYLPSGAGSSLASNTAPPLLPRSV